MVKSKIKVAVQKAANGFQNQMQLRPVLCHLQQPEVFGFCQLFFLRAVGLTLGLDVFNLTV